MTRFAILAAAALPLAGCAFSDMLGGYDRNGGYYGQGGPNFEEVAADACAREASRYGRPAVRDVRRAGSSAMRVTGTVDVSNYGRRGFGCTYRQDGRIVDFDID